MASHSTSILPRPSPERHESSRPATGTTLSTRSAVEPLPTATTALALQQSERKRQALFNTIAEMIFVVARTGVVREFHAPPDSDYLLSADGLVGKCIKDLLPPQVGLQAMHYVEKALRTGETQMASYQLQMRNGVRHFEARLTMYDTDQVIALVRDVTDRTFLEKEILEISNREQMRIGQDLHDGLGQHLTGITFLAKALERKLAARSLPEAAEAGEINRLILQALSQTRSLARGLFPVELESSGLVATFRELAERVRQTFNIDCHLESNVTTLSTSRSTALHLFRLVQEAVSNAVRHGQAKSITIALKKNIQQTMITVSDDGAGFSTADNPRKGLGLRIMTYRAQKIGGTLDVQSQVGRGTAITCAFAESPDAP